MLQFWNVVWVSYSPITFPSQSFRVVVALFLPPHHTLSVPITWRNKTWESSPCLPDDNDSSHLVLVMKSMERGRNLHPLLSPLHPLHTHTCTCYGHLYINMMWPPLAYKVVIQNPTRVVSYYGLITCPDIFSYNSPSWLLISVIRVLHSIPKH